MISKEEQMKEASSLTEKITRSIMSNLREHVGITTKEATDIQGCVFDGIFDAVVESYRTAVFYVEERDDQ